MFLCVHLSVLVRVCVCVCVGGGGGGGRKVDSVVCIGEFFSPLL